MLNDNLICEFSNDEKAYPVGVSFYSVLANDVVFEKGKTSKTMVRIGDKYCCAIITPVTEEFFICQIFDTDSIFEMAQFSGVYGETLPIISANGIELNNIEDDLKDIVQCETVKNDTSLDKKLLETTVKTSIARGRFEELLTYYEISFSVNNHKAVINLYELLDWSVKKCNTLLLECGRNIDFDCHDHELFVHANNKHAVICIMDLLQFALLHSPFEASPFVSLEKRNGKVILIVTCRSFIFVPDGDEDKFITADCNGLEIVRRFLKRSDAEFKFINENNKVIGFQVIFPEWQDKNMGSLLFESTDFFDYDNRFHLYASYKMGKVLEVYGKNKAVAEIK